MSPRYCLIPCNDANTLKNYETAFNNNNVKLLGFPRNDIFFNEELKAGLSFEDLEYLKKYSKIFLYAPTWRDYTSFNPFSENFLRKINSYCQDENILFLVKQHPYNQQFKISVEYQNIKDISRDVADPQELLSKVNLLITDYSSIVFDFVLTDQPVISYIPDYEEYTSKNRETYFDYKAVFPGPFLYSEEALFEKITGDFAWFEDSEYKNRYVAFKDRFNFYKDAFSAKRIFGYLNKE
jgi:CDP-glycerol glycerophosphotransferase